MASTKPSELHQILKIVRMLAILIGAAVGLSLGNPLHVLAVRLLLLWAALYFTFGLFELVLQYLSSRATAKVIRSTNINEDQNTNILNKTPVK
jgi:hypothetical protein